MWLCSSSTFIIEDRDPSAHLDILTIREHDRAVKRRLDLAIYAFTDRILAALLVREAEQGSVMRIYRDGEQYENDLPRRAISCI
jgi:hypothetical protein